MLPSKGTVPYFLLRFVHSTYGATNSLVFLRFFTVESWNPEYPYATPSLLCEKRMSFLLLTLVVYPEVELVPPCYKGATSYVQK